MNDVAQDNSRRVTQGVFEAVIIAIITGAASSFITVKVQQRDIEALQQSVSEVKQELKEIRNDVYVPRTRVAVGESK